MATNKTLIHKTNEILEQINKDINDNLYDMDINIKKMRENAYNYALEYSKIGWTAGEIVGFLFSDFGLRYKNVEIHLNSQSDQQLDS